ncbi:hypothetical protein FRB99_002925 [Tulasnella sp. 403]|nr:hypothetical protein FRB99_002925 [Tulasnella sp. 403]
MHLSYLLKQLLKERFTDAFEEASSQDGATSVEELADYHYAALKCRERALLCHNKLNGLAKEPQNIVVQRESEPSGKPFITDYGVAKRHGDVYRSVGFCGTEGWMAPEIQGDATWDPRSADVWAMAKVLKYLADPIALISTPAGPRKFRHNHIPSSGILGLHMRQAAKGEFDIDAILSA